MKNKKIYKMEVFNKRNKRFRVLHIGEAFTCFEMIDEHADKFTGDDYCYYLTGFVDDIYQTIAVGIRDSEYSYNLEL